MTASSPPVGIQELLSLSSQMNVQPSSITFANVTLESDKYICVRETSPQNQLLIVDLSQPSAPQRRPISADSAIMNPKSQIIALKAKVEGTSGDNLQVFNLGTKQKLKAIQFGESVVFWKWYDDSNLGLVTATSVYHWNIHSDSNPVKIFDRTSNLENTQIISYRKMKYLGNPDVDAFHPINRPFGTAAGTYVV